MVAPIHETTPSPARGAGVRRRARPGRIPSVAVRSLRLVARAAPGAFAFALASQVVVGLGVGVQVALARELIGGFGSAGGVDPSTLTAVVVVTVVVLVCDQLRTDQQRVLGEAAAVQASDLVLAVATSVPLEELDRAEHHDRLSRAQLDVVSRPPQLAFAVLTATSSGVAVLSVLGVLLAIDASFVALAGLAGVPLVGVALVTARQNHRFEREQTPAVRRRQYFFFLMAGRPAAADIRAYDLGPRFRARHRLLHEQRVADLRAFVRRRSVVVVAGMALSGAGLVAAMATLSSRVDDGSLAPSSAVAAIGGLLLLSTRLQPLATSLGAIVESALFLDDVEALTGRLPSAAARDAACTAGGAVRLEDAWFTYPARAEPALRGVTIEIGSGEVVALVGENGSGKSTVVRTVAGLYRPSAGTLHWGAVERSSVADAAWHAHVAAVFQEHVRYNLTIREFVALGRLGGEVADHDGIERALATAGLTDLVAALPAGVDTVLGPEFLGGTDLSGGQWQRLALARALHRDARLVVLDEPTAALDAEAEASWFAGLRSLLGGRSALVVSHRFSTVRAADRIYVLHAGQVVEQGDHHELMSRGGRYARLYELQASAYREPAER